VAIYGSDKYGAPTTYGGLFSAGTGFDLSPISAMETEYGVVTLSWVPPATSFYSRVRIVRSNTGFPVTVDDGKVVLEFTQAATSQSYTDAPLTEGTTYYYSFFIETTLDVYSTTKTYPKGYVVSNGSGLSYVSMLDANLNNALTNTIWWAPIFVTTKWLLAGDVAILVTKKYGFTNNLYTGLPRAYRGNAPDWLEDPGTGFAVDRSAYPDLGRFLSVFGWGLDGIRTKYDTILKIINAKVVPVWYMEAMAGHIGAALEPSVTARLQRMFLDNHAELSHGRGKSSILVEAINAVFGWDAAVTMSSNLMLNENIADIKYPNYIAWDPATAYQIGDRVFMTDVVGGSGTYGGVFQAISAVSGLATAPALGATSNTWWTFLYQIMDSTISYRRDSGSVSGWGPVDPVATAVRVAIGTTSPATVLQTDNALAITRVTAGTATATSVPDYLPVVWASGGAYLSGQTVTYVAGGLTSLYKLKTAGPSTTVPPNIDPTNWELLVQSYTAGVIDPKRVYEKGIPISTPVVVAATATDAGDVFTTVSPHGLVNGQTIRFATITTTTGINTVTDYFVKVSTATTFQVSLTSGLVVNTITTDGSVTYYSTSFVASCYVSKADALVSTAQIGVVWYTSAGISISTSSVAVTTLAASPTWTRISNPAIMPVGAAYAAIWITLGPTTATGAVVLAKRIQFEAVGTVASAYNKPRTAQVFIRPDRVNLITNPQMTVDASGWATAFGTTGAGTTTRVAGPVTPGTVTAAGFARATWTTASTAVGGGIYPPRLNISGITSTRAYVGQMWVRSSIIQRLRINIDWYNSASIIIGGLSINGPQVVVAANTWTLLTATGIAPAGAVGHQLNVLAVAGTSAVNWPIGSTLDSTLAVMEEGPVVLPFFDGSINDQDHYWSGAANASPSYYYQGIARKKFRVDDLIKDYVPMNIPWTTTYAMA
jgi:hypothetical protein